MPRYRAVFMDRRRAAVMRFVREHPACTTAEVAKGANLSNANAYIHLRALVSQGLIVVRNEQFGAGSHNTYTAAATIQTTTTDSTAAEEPKP